MQPSELDFESLLSLAEDDLFLEIDRQLAPPGFFVDARGIEQRIDSGKTWFQKRRWQISNKICSSAARAALSGAGESAGRNALLIAVADLIASVVVGVSPFTVAAIILKMGLDKFCGEQRPEPGV